VLVDTLRNSEDWRPQLSLLQEFPTSAVFGTMSSSSEWMKQFTTSLAPLQNPLPSNVHLLTMEVPFKNSSDYLFRFNHIFEKGSSSYSKNATVDIDTLFDSITPSSVVEKTLSLLWDKDELHRQQWSTQTVEDDTTVTEVVDKVKDTTISLSPIDMKTFYVRF